MGKMLKKAAVFCTAFTFLAALLPVPFYSAEEHVINVTIDTTKEQRLISPYIYGIQYGTDLSGLTVKAIKQGGNSYTTYNWENNFSNSGSDWYNSNDNSLVKDIDRTQWSQYGLITEGLVTDAAKNSIPMTIATLPMGDYVAADGNGPILPDQIAPSFRWNELQLRKPSALTLEPDLQDGKVYTDEYLNFIINKYGKSSTNTGIKAYALDNEPELWSKTHQTMMTHPLECQDLIERSSFLASLIKGLDEQAVIIGGQFADAESLINMQNPEEWEKVRGDYNWFLDYYLDEMKKQSAKHGKRLIDAVDFHYYSADSAKEEETVASCQYPSHTACNKQRMQSVRTLWDGTYTENSILGNNYKQYIPLLPTVQASINKYYSGTKISISSYDFGGGEHISGGLAQADALGIFAKYGVYLACLNPGGDNIRYQKAAINLFTNYNGEGSGFGNTYIKSEVDEYDYASAYASIDNANQKIVKLILINKNYDTKQQVHIKINSGEEYASALSYGFNSKSSDIKLLHQLKNISGNSFSYTMEPLSVVQLILYSNEEDMSKITGDTDDATEVISDVSQEEFTEPVTEKTTENISETTFNTETVTIVTEGSENLPQEETKDAPAVIKFIAVVMSCGVIALSAALLWTDIIKKKKL